MLKFFSSINPIILDVTFISVLVLIIFFGCIRGIKKTLLEFALVLISLFLGFSPYMNSVKDVLISKVLLIDKWLPAGSGNFYVFAASMFLPLMASVLLFLLFYLVFKVIVVLIATIRKRKFGGQGKKKSKVGRVFASLVSLLYGGVITVLLLFVLNTNIVGLKPLTEKSTVVKYVIEKAENLLNKKDERLSDRIRLKIYQGDIMSKISDEFVDSFDYIDIQVSQMFTDKKYIENIEKESFTKEEAQLLVKQSVLDLYNVSIISKNLDDKNNALTPKFVKMAEEMIKVMNKKVNVYSLTDLGYNINDKGTMKDSLKEAGINNELLALLDEIFVGK